MSDGFVGVVYYDETGATRAVTRFCERCQRSISQGDHTRRMTVLSEVAIVSPGGIAHAGHERVEGVTACGMDATGPEWWWRQ